MAKTRLKKETFSVRYQAREEVEIAIKDIGDLQRELQRKMTAQNDEIAAITERYAPELQAIKEQLESMQDAVQAWCESHRDELTRHGKTKTANFNTGDVQWRQRPPSVNARGIPTILENLKKLGLIQFIRTKEELNKEAILNEPELAKTVAGISIKTCCEDFVITPFEQKDA